MKKKGAILLKTGTAGYIEARLNGPDFAVSAGRQKNHNLNLCGASNERTELVRASDCSGSKNG